MSEFPVGAPPPVDEDEELYYSTGEGAAERVQRSFTSVVATNRRRAAKELPEAVRSLCPQDAAERFVPILQDLVRDEEAGVRQAACEAAPETAERLPLAAVTDGILPALAALAAADPSAQVRQAACCAIATVGTQLAPDVAERAVLPVVARLAADPDEEDRRAEAAALAARVAPTLGPASAAAAVVPLCAHLAQDSSFRVRRATAAALGTVAEVVGTDTATATLLPLFLQLAQDTIWSVRKACADAAVDFARWVRPDARRQSVISVMRTLLDDQSRWVRSAAFQNLGPFVALLEPASISPDLLQLFASMALEEKSRRLGDSDIRHYAAFSFPGVLQAVGRERWPEIRETFVTLAADLQWKVRKSLACSLHVIALLLGGGNAADEALSATFEAFFRDIDEVRSGVIANASRFLGVLSPPARERYLPLISELLVDTSWRIRKLLAK